MEQEMLKLILVEIREMKGDISELKDTVKSMDTRLTKVERDVAETKIDVAETKRDVAETKRELAETKKDVKSLKEISEFHTENINAIKNVVSSHYMEFKKFVKANATQHNLYDAKLLQFNKDK